MAHDISPAEQAELHSPQNELPDSHAHHLHEFGHVDRLVHVAASHSSADEIHPVAPVSNKSPLARNERWRRLARRLYRPRHLMQYFFNDTLYRTRDIRRVSSEELFLDLVIVAAVASLGHELRAQPISWRSVEKFLLLFAAVYQSWRQAVFLWNLWGVHQDLIEKSGIYLTFVSIVGIAIGAHGAFDDGIRPYVAVSAFLATAIPTSGAVVWAFQERLLKNPANRANQLLISGIFVIFSVLPYLAAAFVSTDTAARALYWTAFGIQPFAAYGPYLTYSRLHRKIPNHTRLAFNIELIVEKFEVLTMIVLGETVIGLLFEGNGTYSHHLLSSQTLHVFPRFLHSVTHSKFLCLPLCF